MNKYFNNNVYKFNEGYVIENKYKVIDVKVNDDKDIFDYYVNLYNKESNDYSGKMVGKSSIQLIQDSKNK